MIQPRVNLKCPFLTLMKFEDLGVVSIKKAIATQTILFFSQKHGTHFGSKLKNESRTIQ